MVKIDKKFQSITAKKIADLIYDIDTGYRGDLFLEVAIELRKKDQNYTAQLFEYFANQYGFSVKEEEYDCPIHGKLGGIDECPLC